MSREELLLRWNAMTPEDRKNVLAHLADVLENPTRSGLLKIQEVFNEYETRPDVYAQVAP